ncbi:MAG TPA: hypothetical protein VJ739_17895, partial [Gemmataceae bacterium]|nr:hypothetical protein [Gemmataceae bacterium]
MKTPIAVAILMTLAAGPGMADLQTSFDACAKKTGKDYVEARDAFLKAAPAETAKPFLQEKLKSNAWQDRLAARILLGWEDHREEYRGLLAEPKLTNQQGAAHYPWALGREGVKAEDVPLLVELLTKDISAGATWDAARALVGLAQSRPDLPLDARLLHRVLRSPDTPTEERRAVAWVLGSLPAKYQNVGELKDSLK